MTGACVRLDVGDGIAAVTLARPEKHNALDPPMFAALVAAGDELASRHDVRAVVLSGEGPSFCSGLDFASITDEARPGLIDCEPGAPANTVQRAALVWRELAVPVIAALHGHVLGGGLQIALGADVRIAAPGTRLAILELVHGLVPDMGLTVTLPGLVGLDVAKELAWSGRAIDAAEAQQIGLVTRVAERPREASLELARAVAERSPDAVREAKALFNGAWERHGSERLLEAERASQRRLRPVRRSRR